MNYYYYRVCKYNNLTCQKGNKISEGLVKTKFTEDIYVPNATKNGFPKICSIDNFSHSDYILEYWPVKVTSEYCEQQKP